MCGIIAGVTNRPIAPILLAGLQRLEYRGYDSAGLSIINADGALHCIRQVGKVAQLTKQVDKSVNGHIGIAHTRWATHGAPTEHNAHPHHVAPVSLVHNGIIENADELKTELQKSGITFESDTDTEVIAHLLAKALQKDTPLTAIQNTVAQLKGAYGIVVMLDNDPNQLYALRSGSPLVIGLGISENFLASDSVSLLPVTSRFIYLEEGDIATITRDSVSIMDRRGSTITRDVVELDASAEATSKGNFKHYMQKEIFEQPQVLQATLQGRLTEHGVINNLLGAASVEKLKQIKNIKIIACGTSYHAGLTAKYWLETHANIACDVEIASEFRYRNVIVPDQCVLIAISQSGETADTLAAVRKAKGYLATLAITNVATSSLMRETEWHLLTHAGPEIGVASTKAFTTQLAALAMLTILLRQQQKLDCQEMVTSLRACPQYVEAALQLEHDIQALSRHFADKHHTLFLGRGAMYPIALEGALKLKEISYIHAEAYPAGELKHGPLALVDDSMPVVVIAAQDTLLEKVKSNMAEVSARDGELFAIAHTNDLPAAHQVTVGTSANWLDPLIFTIPLQLLAYHVALLKGTDVDQPRNLAKSVTVE